MEECNLQVELREGFGSAASRNHRRGGKIPFVVYRRGMGSVMGSVDANEFIKLASRSRASQIFRLKSESSILDDLTVIVKEVQKEYIKRSVLHLDFQALTAGEHVVVSVPIELVGEAPGVKTQGGVLSQMLRSARVSCLPASIPDSISIDISSLVIGQSLNKGSIPLPEGVTLMDDPAEMIVTVVGTRASRMMEDAAAAEKAAGKKPAKKK